MTEYTGRITRMSHAADDTGPNDELTIHIEIVDRGAGEFVRVRRGNSDDCVDINPDEWPTLQAAIGRMVSACQSA